MHRVSASAPGKVVVCGEYAVLDGAPAICMAVNRRARVTIAASEDDYHSVTALGHTTSEGRFVVADGCFDWLQSGGEFGLVEHVWRAAAVMSPETLALQLDTREFTEPGSGKKYGIGSSAALAVALTAALARIDVGARDLREAALTAHRGFQGGRGSGVDVACAAQGGVIEYRGNRAVPRRWPAGLAYALLWSGVPSSTHTRLEKFRDVVSKPSRAALAAAAECVASAWADAPVVALLDALRAYTEVLRRFSVDHDLGIFDAGHAELADAAARDVVYKPCGAGGGDVGIVLAADEDALGAFIDTAATRNFVRLDIVVDSEGVKTIEAEHQ